MSKSISILVIIITFISSIPSPAQWVQLWNAPASVSCFAIAPDGVGGTNLFAGTGGGGVFLSTNDGLSWAAVNTGLTDYSVLSITVSDTNLFVGTENAGLFRSTNNGTSWIDVNAGFTGSEVWSFAVSDANLFAGAMWGGVFRSTDDGNYWSSAGLYYVASLLFSDTDLFAGTAGAGMYLSTNNGSSWTEISNGLPAYLPVYSITEGQNATNANKEIFIGATGSGSSGGVFRSTDNGLSWAQVMTNMSVYDLTASGSKIFAGTEHGLFLSTNSGTEWVNLNIPYPVFPSAVISIQISEIFLYAYTLSGKLWRRPLSEIIPVELVSFSAMVNYSNVELSWITSTETNNQGFEILRSAQNDSESWERIGFVEGHGTTTETQVYSFIDKNLLGGKYNYRLKQIDFDGTFEYSNVIEVEVTSTSTFSVEQNYPNPFNPSTKIKFTIPSVIASGAKQSQFVSLKVYDMLGNEVAKLVNEYKSAGNYEVEFSADELTSGIYFYKLQADSFVETKKMIILK